MNFYKHHIGDYLKKTAHLSLAQHGAYLLMLQTYYATEAPLPKGDALYRVLRATTKLEREAVDAIVEQYWVETNDGFVNARADEEIALAQRQREVNRTVGKKGGRPRSANRTETESVLGGITESVSESVIESVSVRKPNRNPIQTPDSNIQESSSRKQRESDSNSGDAVPKPMAIAAIKAAYPAGLHRQSDWILAERHVLRLLDDGESAATLLAAAQGYAKQQQAAGNVGTRFILSPSRFFGDDGHWRGPFPIPEVAKSASPTADPDAVRAWELLLASNGADRPPRAQHALDAVGGWSRVRLRTDFDTLKLRAEFCRAYAEAAA